MQDQYRIGLGDVLGLLAPRRQRFKLIFVLALRSRLINFHPPARAVINPPRPTAGAAYYNQAVKVDEPRISESIDVGWFNTT